MTKAELVAALAGYPDDAVISIYGRPRRPDGDRYHEIAGEIRPLNIADDIFLDDDVHAALKQGAVVISIDVD